MKKTVVVTGGSGFVGANLVRRLVKEGYKTHILVRKESNLWRLRDIERALIIHEDVLTDKKGLFLLMKKIQPYAIFHLATFGAYPSQQDMNKMVEINILGTAHLLESLKNSNYTQLVITASSSEYGKKSSPMREDDSLEPNNMYSATKAGQTYIAQVFSKSNNKPLVILRLFNVYGYYEEKGRLVRSVIESAITNCPIQLASGKEARDLIFIDDVVDAYIHALHDTSFRGEVFNIGTGVQTSILQLARKVKRLVNSGSRIQLNAYPGRPWDTYHWKADMRKTKRYFDWESTYTLEQGLQKTIAWYRKQND